MASYADVCEGVRAAIAEYTHALDDGRTDDVVATFCADGASELPQLGTHEGHEALRAAYVHFVPRGPQRHIVANVRVTTWSDAEAQAVSDVVLVLKGESGWSVAFVGRYHDTLHCEGGAWRFHRRSLAGA